MACHPNAHERGGEREREREKEKARVRETGRQAGRRTHEKERERERETFHLLKSQWGCPCTDTAGRLMANNFFMIDWGQWSFYKKA